MQARRLSGGWEALANDTWCTMHASKVLDKVVNVGRFGSKFVNTKVLSGCQRVAATFVGRYPPEF